MCENKWSEWSVAMNGLAPSGGHLEEGGATEGQNVFKPSGP